MITREKLEHHISHLEEKVSKLKDDATEAYMHGDDMLWETIKKKKLRLKDEIESCKKQMLAL